MKILKSIKIIFYLIIISYPDFSYSAPKINVVSRTNTSGNTEWRVFISPDAAQFTNVKGRSGGSIAFEGTFEVLGSTFTRGIINYSQWNNINPGHNPFTNTVTKGLYLSGNRAYLSIGSKFLISGAPSLLITFETPGTAATRLSWGGATVLTGTPLQYTTVRVSQKGINNNNLNGALNRGSVPDSITCENERKSIASVCSQAIGYKNETYAQQCSSKIVQALNSCKTYGNIYSICSEASINHELGCSIPNFSLCGLLGSRTGECDSLLP